MKPERVFMVVGRLLPAGGVEEYLATLGAQLARRGISVSIFSWRYSPPPNPVISRLVRSGVAYHQPPAWRGLWMRARRVLGGGTQAGLFERHQEDLLQWMRQAAARHAPDVIHVHRVDSLPLLRAPFFRGYPLVYTEHGLPAPEWGDFSFEINQADTVVAVSEAAKTALATLWSCQRPIQVVHPIVDVPARVEAQPEQAGPVRLAYFGRLDPNKNVEGIVQAFAQLDRGKYPASLKIWGDGPSRKSIKAQVDRLGLGQAVQLCGPYAHAKLSGLMDSTDGVVHFSFSEGLPVGLVEAMAYAKPVLAAGVGGILELIQPEVSGLLVPPGEVAALAGAMTRLVTEPSLRQRLGRAARQRFEESGFSPQQVVERMEAVYAQAIRLWRQNKTGAEAGT